MAATTFLPVFDGGDNSVSLGHTVAESMIDNSTQAMDVETPVIVTTLGMPELFQSTSKLVEKIEISETSEPAIADVTEGATSTTRSAVLVTEHAG